MVIFTHISHPFLFVFLHMSMEDVRKRVCVSTSAMCGDTQRVCACTSSMSGARRGSGDMPNIVTFMKLSRYSAYLCVKKMGKLE